MWLVQNPEGSVHCLALAVSGGGSSRRNGDGKSSRKRLKDASGSAEGVKYTRYTDEQVEVLERIYADCPNPNQLRRTNIMREEPLLKDTDHKHLKVWFQNRRSRAKHKKENEDLVAEVKRLNDINKVLREEKNALQEKISQLEREIIDLKNQVPTLTSTCDAAATTNDLGQLPDEANSSRHPNTTGDNFNRLLALAEEARNEFLSKATGTSINWIPIPTTKVSGLSSLAAMYISNTCTELAARACAIVPFPPIKTMEFLKDRLSWSRHCRNLEVHTKVPADNGGSIELIYTQYYAPTTLACARDFWTLRYTSIVDDDSILICEKSVSGSDIVPSSPAVVEFVRAEKLASGYLVRPSEGGSTVHLVEHLDYEASSVLKSIHSLYQSPELMAKIMIIPALDYIEHISSETNDKARQYDKEAQPYLQGMPPFRFTAESISRCFNTAINGSTEDGWTLMNANASDDIIVSVNPTITGLSGNYDCVICIKTSLILQNISPAKLVRLLKEKRSTWMGFNFSDNLAAVSRDSCFPYPGLGTHDLSEEAYLLGRTSHEEKLEIIRFRRTSQHGLYLTKDIYHLQISSGMEDTDFGACSEFIFAPIDRTSPLDFAHLSSGFRIFSLGSNAIDGQGTSSSASLTFNKRDSSHSRSLLILAFQFPFETHLHDEVVAVAKLYVQHVISIIKNISPEVLPIEPSPMVYSAEETPAIELNINQNSTCAVNLAKMICESYRSFLGVEILGVSSQDNDSLVELIEHHPYAIMCFPLTPPAHCLYANQSALDMLETTKENLHLLTVDKILDSPNNMAIATFFPTLSQEGYAILSTGYLLSVTDRCISYEQGVMWLVLNPDGSVHCLALAVSGWSFFDI